MTFLTAFIKTFPKVKMMQVISYSRDNVRLYIKSIQRGAERQENIFSLLFDLWCLTGPFGEDGGTVLLQSNALQ